MVFIRDRINFMYKYTEEVEKGTKKCPKCKTLIRNHLKICNCCEKTVYLLKCFICGEEVSRDNNLKKTSCHKCKLNEANIRAKKHYFSHKKAP